MQASKSAISQARTRLALPVQQELVDGSYLSTVYDSDDRAKRSGQQVRVIDYTLEDSATLVPGSYRQHP